MKNLLAIILLAALAFTGCGKNDDGESGGNGGSAKGNLVGLWLATDYISAGETYVQQSDEYYDYAIEFISDGLYNFYDVSETKFSFSNGYIYGCTKSNFDKIYTAKYNVENGVLFTAGVSQGKIVFKSNDKFYLTDDDGDTDVYSRVKGFK